MRRRIRKRGCKEGHSRIPGPWNSGWKTAAESGSLTMPSKPEGKNYGWETGIRTPIRWSRATRLTIRRSPSTLVILRKQTARCKTYHSGAANNRVLAGRAAYNLGPCIAKSHSSVKNQSSRHCVRIHAEIPQPFNLISVAGLRFCKARFDAARPDNLQ